MFFAFIKKEKLWGKNQEILVLRCGFGKMKEMEFVINTN
jgi:hypothetical protein